MLASCEICNSTGYVEELEGYSYAYYPCLECNETGIVYNDSKYRKDEYSTGLYELFYQKDI